MKRKAVAKLQPVNGPHENSSTWCSLHSSQLVLSPCNSSKYWSNLVSSGERFDALEEDILHLLHDLAEAILLLIQICIDQRCRLLQLILNSGPRRFTPL